MLIGLVAGGLLTLAVFGLTRCSLPFASNLQGHAEPSGGWALAWGGALGPLALTVIGAARVEPLLTVHLLGRPITRVPLSRCLPKRVRATPEFQSSNEQAEESAPELRLLGWLSGLDPVELVISWWESERIVQLDSLSVELKYSFRDISLTGRILAASYLLTAVLPAGYTLRQTPSWESEDRAGIEADAKLRFWPGRLVLWLVRFMLKQRSETRARARLAKRAMESS